MIHHLVWVDGEGDIKMVKIAKGDNNPSNGSIDLANNNWIILHKMEPIENMQEFMEERYWNSAESIFKQRTARPNRLATWVNQAWTWDSNLLLDDIRVERNMRLFHSDWTVFTDSPLSDSEKTEAQTYRAALRNFPSTVDMSSVTSVSDAPWPTKPSFISE
tara:strand:- start:38 stop:520 length:483 start_codon:yes stop_codon:yes gene_type:complete